MIRKLVTIGAALALSSSLLAAGTAHATDPIDNTGGTVSCDTVTKGVIKAKPPLTIAGGFPTVLSVSGTLQGCTTNVAGVTLPDGKSKFKGTISAADNGCAGLSGPSTSTGTITISWGTVPAVTNKTSVVTLASGSTSGGFGSVAGGARGLFDLGTGPPSGAVSPPPSAPLSVTGGFTGGDNGNSSGATVATQESIGVILALCSGLKGVKQLTIAAGALQLS